MCFGKELEQDLVDAVNAGDIEESQLTGQSILQGVPRTFGAPPFAAEGIARIWPMLSSFSNLVRSCSKTVVSSPRINLEGNER